MCSEGRMGELARTRGLMNNWMQQKRESGTAWEKKSVPCPKGKLLKLGIGAFKADRTWITELLSHRIWENHTELPVNPVIVKSVGILGIPAPSEEIWSLLYWQSCCLIPPIHLYQLSVNLPSPPPSSPPQHVAAAGSNGWWNGPKT